MAVFCFDRRPAGFLHKYNSLVVPLLWLSRNEQGTWEKTPGRATGLSSWPGMSDRGTTLFSGSGSLAPSKKWEGIESWKLETVNHCAKKYGDNVCFDGFEDFHEDLNFDQIECIMTGEIGKEFRYEQNNPGILYSSCDARSKNDIIKAAEWKHSSITQCESSEYDGHR